MSNNITNNVLVCGS